MSGTLSNIYNNVGFALSQHADAMARLQEQVASGSRINRASDDPSAAYQILGLKSQERSLGNYIDNISDVVNMLEVSTTSIDIMKLAFSRAIGLLNSISGTSGTGNLVEGINSALEDMVMWANSDYLGQYLFGGGDTSSAPYLVERTDGRITSVTYQGSLEDRNIEVAPGVESSSFYIGDNIFRSNDRSAPIFPDTGTGAAAGTGTSSVRGDVWLTVTHDGDNYWLSIDDGDNEVKVPSAGDISNIAVTNSAGQVLYVDATNIGSTGVDWVRVPGTYDIFNTLITIRDRLESGGDIEELRSNGLKSLNEVYNVLIQTSVSLGSKMGFLDNLKDGLNNIKYNTEDDVTRLAEADIAQIAIDLSRREVLYQMSLSVAARLMSMSLLDFIS